ncbi:mandelate racemase/muconate lactonizing enzyme family protein [Roseivirga thermotolerans]|uniref:Dipeptide epimerase n=1 Tax=Roseivirga thermotolerans TaxID=1758176 RepID=A0ABQ3I6N6_9BACT|nr:dipeptide epimerase [Roseivirga thermotolerans]GHE68947.1 dipeptide epimerase [Roseivirga thermotolerans]
MKIKKIEFFKAHIPLKKTFATSLGKRDTTTSIFVRVTNQKGLCGWGECSPFPPIVGETPETCFIVGKMLAEKLLNEDPREVGHVSKLMDRIIFGHTGIKSAIDIACHDLWAKSCDEPLYLTMGGRIEKTIRTDFTISLDSVETMTNDALEKVQEGFKTLKIKLGDDASKDIKRIKSIRQAVGNSIDLRVDANQGWTQKEAIRCLNEMASLNIQYCEEPINKRRYYQLKKVINNSPVKIMADESLMDHVDARKLVKGGYCDYFNIKLGKSSGLYKARKILKVAERYGILCQIGGFVESRLLFTANTHLAHLSDLVRFYDLDSPLFHQFDPIVGGMEYQKNWDIRIPDQPGLGLEVSADFLKECESLTVE